MPRTCPEAGHSAEADPGCRPRVQQWRSRKTGVARLLVVECVVHEVVFTVYPPSQVPYGREPIADVSPVGETLLRSEGGLRALHSTAFTAALDAEAGKIWPRTLSCETPGVKEVWSLAEDGEPPGVRTTQRSRLRRLVLLLGLAADLSVCLREQMREVLGLPGLVMRKAVDLLRAAPSSLRRQGEGVHGLLQVLRGKRLARGIAICGHLAGLWGRPLRWDEKAGALLPLGRVPRPPPG